MFGASSLRLVQTSFIRANRAVDMAFARVGRHRELKHPLEVSFMFDLQKRCEEYYNGQTSSESDDSETYVKGLYNNRTVNVGIRYTFKENEWHEDNHPVFDDVSHK